MGVRALLYPPFLLKTKIQVARGASEKSAFQVAKATVREEGVRGLYKVCRVCSSIMLCGFCNRRWPLHSFRGRGTKGLRSRGCALVVLAGDLDLEAGPGAMGEGRGEVANSNKWQASMRD